MVIVGEITPVLLQHMKTLQFPIERQLNKPRIFSSGSKALQKLGSVANLSVDRSHMDFFCVQ